MRTPATAESPHASDLRHRIRWFMANLPPTTSCIPESRPIDEVHVRLDSVSHAFQQFSREPHSAHTLSGLRLKKGDAEFAVLLLNLPVETADASFDVIDVLIARVLDHVHGVDHHPALHPSLGVQVRVHRCPRPLDQHVRSGRTRLTVEGIRGPTDNRQIADVFGSRAHSTQQRTPHLGHKVERHRRACTSTAAGSRASARLQRGCRRLRARVGDGLPAHHLRHGQVSSGPGGWS
jgi:hypothetical protein